MSSRLPLMTAVLALTIFAGSIHSVWGTEPGRLAALAARQDLRDEVCICMADGKISPQERSEILKAAKNILKPDEYEGFKQSLDRAAPPVLVQKKLPTSTVPKKPVEQKPLTSAVKKKSPSVAQSSKSAKTKTVAVKKTSKKPAKSGEALITDKKESDEVILSDRVADLGKAR